MFSLSSVQLKKVYVSHSKIAMALQGIVFSDDHWIVLGTLNSVKTTIQ